MYGTLFISILTLSGSDEEPDSYTPPGSSAYTFPTEIHQPSLIKCPLLIFHLEKSTVTKVFCKILYDMNCTIKDGENL